MNHLSTEAEMETGAQCRAVVQVSKVKADIKVGGALAVLQTS